jgi:nucleotide-binding universal stress UspA family protein
VARSYAALEGSSRVVAWRRSGADWPTRSLPLIAVRVEGLAYPNGSETALIRGHARLTDALRRVDGKTPTHAVRVGDPATALVAAAEDLRAQMLVVGKGCSGTLLGDVSEEVSTRASCPVVAVPQAQGRERARQRRHLLCAFDGSDDARAALGVAAAMAARLGTAAFVAHMRTGCLDDLQAHAQAGRAAMVVAPSRAVQGWHSSLAESAQDRWAPVGRIPLLLVPPAYAMSTAQPPRVAAAV